MPDYSKWDRKHAAVTRLQLDPQNPRIPWTGRLLSQRELIAELVYHENVLDLAKSIATQGFFPTDALVVVEENEVSYVLEGNRRLAALKLLLSPQSAPADRVRQFHMVAEGLPSTSHIARVQVVIAPSRDAATPLIIDRHTHSQIERWSPIMQARFYRTLLQRGYTRQDVCATFGVKAPELSESLRNDALYAMACALDLPASVREKVHSPRTFPMSSLERVLEFRHVQEFLGISFDDRDDVLIGVDLGEFTKAYAKIVEDVATGYITSRKLNTADDVKDYLAEFGAAAPDPSKKGRYTAADVTRGPSQPSAAPPPVPPPVRGPRQSRSIVPRRMRCLLANPRISDVFTELKRLHVADFPNATAVVLRTLLEMCVSYRIDKTGNTSALLAPYKKQGKPADWYPSLKLQLEFLLRMDEASFPVPPLGRKSLKKILSQKDSPIRLEHLDGYVHNRYVLPTEKDLRAIWEALEPAMEVLLSEPAVSGSP